MTAQPLCLNDITVFAPPCLTPKRAWDIYEPAFRRIVEYVTNSRIEGDVLEFGTFNGYTARVLAELMHEYRSPKHLHLYDSWEGFPAMEGVDAACPEVTTHDTWHQGDCRPAMEQAPEIIKAVLSIILPDRVHTHKGFYTPYIQLPEKAAIVHVDCDLYESTKIVLYAAMPLLQQGSVIMFDDWNNNMASNEFGERKAVLDIFPHARGDDAGAYRTCDIQPWFSYGSSGMAFLVHKS
jgi:hypothetical protein